MDYSLSRFKIAIKYDNNLWAIAHVQLYKNCAIPVEIKYTDGEFRKWVCRYSHLMQCGVPVYNVVSEII